MTKEQIKALRTKLGLSQTEFAKKINHHYITIGRVERGSQKVSKKLIRAIEREFLNLEGK